MLGSILKEDTDFSELVYKEINTIIGIDFSIEEKPFKAFDDWCEKELFRFRNRRVYKGENWSYESQILELREEINSGEKRLNLWNELSIRAGHKLPFNPSWSITRQEKAIDNLKCWFETDENNSPLQNPWNFGVN